MSSEIVTDLPHRAGFEVVPDVVDRSDVVNIAEQLERGARERNRAGARHLMGHPAVGDLARDKRLLSIAGRYPSQNGHCSGGLHGSKA